MSAAAPGLYVHVPFCSAICPYCDFAVQPDGGERRAGYVAALRRELALWSERAPIAGSSLLATPFDTVYLGGGTPSLLAREQLASVLDEARARLPVAGDAWISLEANPEDVTPAAVADWRALGVRTVTLGVQSFRDDALRFLGRRHTGEEARRAVESTLAAGFDSVGIDLIYGLPGQTSQQWRQDLDTAGALAPPHLSCYQLTIHRGTPFGFRAGRGALAEMPEDEQATLFRLTHEHLPARGYEAYEVSSFARDGASRSRHNRKYWAHVPYLGVGPSAHSFDGLSRWWNRRKLRPWQQAIEHGVLAIEERERLRAADLALEHLLLGLRTREGVELARLAALGVDLVALNPALLARLVDERLVVVSDTHVVPTLAGWAVADGLASAFVLESTAPSGAPTSRGAAAMSRVAG